jgi:hypothetical protein
MLKWTLLDHGCHMSSVFLIHSHRWLSPHIFVIKRYSPLTNSKTYSPLTYSKNYKKICANMKWQLLKSERLIWSLLNHEKSLHNACSIHIHYTWWAVAKGDMSFEFALNVTHLSASYLTCITTTARNCTMTLHIKIWWLTAELHTSGDKILGMMSPKWLNFVWWQLKCLDPQYGVCFIAYFQKLEFWDDT